MDERRKKNWQQDLNATIENLHLLKGNTKRNVVILYLSFEYKRKEVLMSECMYKILYGKEKTEENFGRQISSNEKKRSNKMIKFPI